MRLFTLLLFTPLLAAQSSDISGSWIITVTQFGEPDVRRLKFEPKDGQYSASILGLEFKGKPNGRNVEFQCSYQDEKETKSCGSLTGSFTASGMSGSGTLFEDPITWSASREKAIVRNPRHHEFTPSVFHRQFSGNIAPVMRLNPGDSVHTKAVDAGGVDEAGVKRSQGGNPLTGPFYVEGALNGDTLVVHLNRLRLNRGLANVFSDAILASVVNPFYASDRKSDKNFDSSWKLDSEHGSATLAKPTERLRNFKVKLQPMLGCVGVAPPDKQAFRSGNLGPYGGNMDYNQIREGVTLYFPVFQPGALLFLGDGHAAQGDGELTGNALETSTDIDFTVDLIPGKSLGQPRFENDEYVMVSGIAGSLGDALKMATTGMSRWLADEYKLSTGEIAMVLGTSMRYDIAEVVDPQVHLVAKVSKAALAQIPKP